jgi:hypothetical protein
VSNAGAVPAVVKASSNTQGNMVFRSAVIIDVLLAFPVPCPMDDANCGCECQRLQILLL